MLGILKYRGSDGNIKYCLLHRNHFWNKWNYLNITDDDIQLEELVSFLNNAIDESPLPINSRKKKFKNKKELKKIKFKNLKEDEMYNSRIR